MNLPFNPALFHPLPIVGILRFFPPTQLQHLVTAALDGGIVNFEVTMNSDGADDLLRLACDRVGTRGNVGAGTVTSLDELDRALDAGASFIVTPAVIPEVIRACVDRQIPVMPGAMTPTEVLTAWRLGATLVKIFPADQLGPGHLRALKAPFPKIPLMPTGGVTPDTLAAFRHAGADAVGVGSPLFHPQHAAAENWDWIRARAQAFVQAWKASDPS